MNNPGSGSGANKAGRRIAVVGAGMAGVTAADQLHAMGHDVTLFERHFCPGGRMATRHHGQAQWDHGAQYFTASDAGFIAQVQHWQERGWVAPWHGRLIALPGGGPPPFDGDVVRWVALAGMNQLAASRCESLSLRTDTPVSSVAPDQSGWKLSFDQGHASEHFDALVLAVTPGQAQALLPAQEPLGSALVDLPMSPCWAAMLALADPIEYGFDAAFVDDPALAWVARDSSKPERTGERWVLHAGADWSRSHVDADPDDVCIELWGVLSRMVGDRLPQPVQHHARYWSQARIEQPLGQACLGDPDRGIVLCGDWCLDARVEAAWLSGKAAAACLG